MQANYESQIGCQLDEELRQRRDLTEVDNLLAAMDSNGNVAPDKKADILLNYRMATQELAMPLAVSVSLHRVEHECDAETGQRQRTITWLGKNAVASAMSGHDYHFSEPAHKRVEVEVAEAYDAEKNLTTGLAKVFISPKMSQADAPVEIAKAEHLADDDAVRVSYAVTDSQGEVVGRHLESLLVRDIELADWLAMLKDSNNIFGKAFDIKNDTSALSVMQLFKELELPESKLPEGPVTLVQAVLPYISDRHRQASAKQQLTGFRRGQAKYNQEADKIAAEWYAFDLELAKSLRSGSASPAIESFIGSWQHKFKDADAASINNHDMGDDYVMTNQLAAICERAKRKLLIDRAAAVVNNQKALEYVDKAVISQIQINQRQIYDYVAIGYRQDEINRLQIANDRLIAGQNIKTGGGCGGALAGAFKNDQPDSLSGDSEAGGESKDKDGWSWKVGTCRVKSCPKPSPTEVGPCNICRRCQAEFDAGHDPTSAATAPSRPEAATAESSTDKLLRELSAKFTKDLLVSEPV